MSTTNNGNQIGIASEAMVEMALLEITKPERRRKFLNPPAVKYVRAKKNSETDARGGDFLIVGEDGTEVVIDVKSSDRQAQKAQKKCRRINRLIGFVVVTAWDTIETVINKVVYCVKSLWAAVRRRQNQRKCVKRMRGNKKFRFYVEDRRVACQHGCLAH